MPGRDMVRAQMLAVGLFVAFWVVVGLGLFFVAIRGGVSGAQATLRTQARRRGRGVDIIFVIVYVGFGIALPVIFLTGNHVNASAQVGGIRLNSSERAGRDVFAQKCGFCHTLAAANAVGKVGPDLDMLQPTETLVLNTIANGCVQNAAPNATNACLGYGTMPAGVISGGQAQDVAAFVARVAGKE
ncbi:MAG: hypothetical protein JOY58_15525 [Solirubrobacterales bacterium]|nr:hypothetical protein [Solirubrobacterales bacterium]MBV9049685.1 hypothetical protein [Solirubrobacterales bacterium]